MLAENSAVCCQEPPLQIFSFTGQGVHLPRCRSVDSQPRNLSPGIAFGGGKLPCLRLHSLPRQCTCKGCLVHGATQPHSRDNHEGLSQLEIAHGIARGLYCNPIAFQFSFLLNTASLTPHRYCLLKASSGIHLRV